MRQEKKFILDEETHRESNCLVVTVICHGTESGLLLDRHRRKAWDTELLVGELSDVQTLVGKPKVLIIQACRGGNSGQMCPIPWALCCCEKTLT